MATSTFLAAVTEFFAQRETEKAIDQLDDRARRAISDALALGRQKAACAETLWSNGHLAEGLALAAAALEATLAAAPSLASARGETTSNPRADSGATPSPETPESLASDDPTRSEGEMNGIQDKTVDPLDVLAAHGMSKADLERVKEALAGARGPLPPLDRDVSPAHAQLYVSLIRCRVMVDDRLAPGAMTHADLRWRRVRRALGAVMAVLAALGTLVWSTRTPTGTFATASDFFQQNPQFAPENVLDGSAATYWLLPDGATGWLEVQVSPPRHVGRIRLQNTTNPPWSDRATADYRLEIYRRDELVRTIDGRFEWSDAPGFVDHPVDLDDVDRVRFVVRSHHRNGAGLAELQLD